MAHNVENISGVQQQVLALIKQRGEASNADIAAHLGVSYEAVRQQLRQLEDAELVVVRKQHRPGPGPGRPTLLYALSPAGDHLFPKNYDELAVELLDALGPDALRHVLAALTDEQVRHWSPHLQDRTLLERLEALQGIYLENDPYMEVSQHETETGRELRLIERNCPYLNVARRRPALCSITLSTLSRLLGYTVTREKRFQDGDGRCVFRVHLDRPLNSPAFRFAFEQELEESMELPAPAVPAG